METDNQIKEMVKQKYSEIALQESESNPASCCGTDCCGTEVYNIMSDDYTQLKGYNPDADLGLGCGLPTQFAKIKKGDVVIDLGSGAGNDCFVARAETGAEGKVIGIDFTTAMIDKARTNTDKLGFNNVEFRQGDIEKMPVTENTANVIVSNCVLNLVPNKDAVFKEIFRVLKPGGHFSIADVVLVGNLPETLQKDAEMYAGCVSGAIQKEEYLALINSNGFTNVTIQKEKVIVIPDDILKRYLSDEQLNSFKSGNSGIFSITVYAEKPTDKMKITILDPAMCCSTGVCGEDVDDKLVATAANVKWLNSLGYNVERLNISKDGEAFMNYPLAIEKLQKEGMNTLPYILINNKIVMAGHYPEKSDWEFWIQNDGVKNPDTESVNKSENKDTDAACCSGTSCC